MLPCLCFVQVELIRRSFRHDSIPTAIEELHKWGPYYNVSFDATEDRDVFTVANLAKYDAIMCVHTTGDCQSIFFAP